MEGEDTSMMADDFEFGHECNNCGDICDCGEEEELDCTWCEVCQYGDDGEFDLDEDEGDNFD